MSLGHGPKIPTADLSLLFDPANSKSYPGSGTTIFDLSGNGNNGTLSGSPVFSNGIMTYDGSDDQIVVSANQNSLDFSSNQTILIWMYHTYTSGRKNPYNQAYGGYGTWTHEQGDNINYFYGDSGGNSQPYTNRNSSTTSTSVWNMMCTTRDTSTVKWYKNDTLINSASNAYGELTTTTAGITFGSGYAGRWIGDMGPMMLYKRALTTVEIQTIFHAYKGRFGL
jgi:hypothetical protein